MTTYTFHTYFSDIKLLIVDVDIENDARIMQMINIVLPIGLIDLTSFRLCNAEIITIKTPINVPVNESIVNINLNRILYIFIPLPRGYTIDPHHHSNDEYHKSQTS